MKKKLTKYPEFAESLSNSRRNCHNCICPEPKRKRKIRSWKTSSKQFFVSLKYKLLNKSKSNFFCSLKNVLTTKVWDKKFHSLQRKMLQIVSVKNSFNSSIAWLELITLYFLCFTQEKEKQLKRTKLFLIVTGDKLKQLLVVVLCSKICTTFFWFL